MAEKKIKAENTFVEGEAHAEKSSAKKASTVVKDTATKAAKTSIKTSEEKKTVKVSKAKASTKTNSTHKVGKRKRTIAKVWISEAKGGKKEGMMVVNGKTVEQFFGPRRLYAVKLSTPFSVIGLNIEDYDVTINTIGGGITGCIDSASLGIARCIVAMFPNMAQSLKDAKLLTRDSRIVEPKKYGLRKARKRDQYSKR